MADEQNGFISLFSFLLGVDSSSVKVLQVSPGSTVVCWAAALPKEALPEDPSAEILRFSELFEEDYFAYRSITMNVSSHVSSLFLTYRSQQLPTVRGSQVRL